MVDFVEVHSRGSNRGPDPSPLPDDVEKLQAHCDEEMQIHIPKLYEKKSLKDGGDPIHFKGKGHFADVLRCIHAMNAPCRCPLVSQALCILFLGGV